MKFISQESLNTRPHPDAPVNLTSSNVTSSSIDLNWDDVSQADGYKIYKNGSLEATESTNSYSLTGLSSNTSYIIYIKSKNKVGESNKSEEISVTTKSK